MEIQIYGAGMAGSYLYMLLNNYEGYNVKIHDERSSPDCRCAWGIAYRQAKALYSEIGLDLDEYIIAKPKNAYANGVKFKVKNIVIFDRKRLLSDLWSEMSFGKVENADIIVDATGSKRAFLPAVNENESCMRYPTVQFIERHDVDENIYAYARKTGYAWAFPLGDNLWHIGAGERSVEGARELIEKLREKYGFEKKDSQCGCTAYVRMCPPSKSLPFTSGNIYGVGEVIGCVSGFGEGNAPALESAKLFHECLINDCLDEYESKILSEFRWIEDEYRFLYAIQNEDKIKALKYARKVARIESERSAELSFKSILSVISGIMK